MCKKNKSSDKRKKVGKTRCVRGRFIDDLEALIQEKPLFTTSVIQLSDP